MNIPTLITAIIVAIATIILQKSFSNIICGINLAFRRPFKSSSLKTLSEQSDIKLI